MSRLLIIAGTRPEGIKLAPVWLEARRRSIACELCSTAQHRELLDSALQVFGIEPEYDLDIMRPGQTLGDCTARAVAGLTEVIGRSQPDAILVQGDTTTTFAGALSGFYAGIPVAHVEAGLRTGHLREPFPEEMNRVLTTRLAAWHFAPSEGAAANLRKEGVEAAQIRVTGNTGIDAVLHVRNLLAGGGLAPAFPVQCSRSKRLVLVTAHRRETFGEPLREICRALAELGRRGDVEVVFPVHPNPAVREATGRWLDGVPGVSLIEPIDYVSFVAAMMRATLILTDSGGVQEEAPALGKPVIVLRNRTERPEGVAAGSAVLAGADCAAIVRIATELLDDPGKYETMAAVRNPYGDGTASVRILDTLERELRIAAPG